jgi:hypothetical protein
MLGNETDVGAGTGGTTKNALVRRAWCNVFCGTAIGKVTDTNTEALQGLGAARLVYFAKPLTPVAYLRKIDT